MRWVGDSGGGPRRPVPHQAGSTGALCHGGAPRFCGVGTPPMAPPEGPGVGAPLLPGRGLLCLLPGTVARPGLPVCAAPC